MIPWVVDYASPSAFESSREQNLLALSADQRRPVRFAGKVKRPHRVALRFGLQALGGLLWSNDSWGEYRYQHFDPLVNVEQDVLRFETFASDGSAYGALLLDRDVFDEDGEVIEGATNIDFTAWMWGALGEMRSSRETWVRIGSEGFDVSTTTAGGRFERRVSVSQAWLRSFAEVQAAMGAPGTKLTLRPVDLLAVIRHLKANKSKLSPRALRYELEPDADARVAIEPFEIVVPLVGATHGYPERRTIRTWGRRRLRTLEPLLPYAESVDVYLRGRARPSFYAVKLPGVTFVLGLTGWSAKRFESAGGWATGRSRPSPEHEAVVQATLRDAGRGTASEIAASAGVTAETATAALERACRLGLATVDLESRAFVRRELTADPLDEALMDPPDLRAEQARELIESKKGHVASAAHRETKKLRRLRTADGISTREVIYRDWAAQGRVADQSRVEVVVDDVGRVIFGKCACEFFVEHLLNDGPCAHMLALRFATEDQRVDRPTSTAVIDDDDLPVEGSE